MRIMLYRVHLCTLCTSAIHDTDDSPFIGRISQYEQYIGCAIADCRPHRFGANPVKWLGKQMWVRTPNSSCSDVPSTQKVEATLKHGCNPKIKSGGGLKEVGETPGGIKTEPMYREHY